MPFELGSFKHEVHGYDIHKIIGALKQTDADWDGFFNQLKALPLDEAKTLLIRNDVNYENPGIDEHPGNFFNFLHQCAPAAYLAEFLTILNKIQLPFASEQSSAEARTKVVEDLNRHPQLTQLINDAKKARELEVIQGAGVPPLRSENFIPSDPHAAERVIESQIRIQLCKNLKQLINLPISQLAGTELITLVQPVENDQRAIDRFKKPALAELYDQYLRLSTPNKVSVCVLAQDSKMQAVLASLNRYQLTRANEGFFSGFGKSLGGVHKFDKMVAAEALSKAIASGEKNDLDRILSENPSALKGGRLGKIFAEACKVDPSLKNKLTVPGVAPVASALAARRSSAASEGGRASPTSDAATRHRSASQDHKVPPSLATGPAQGGAAPDGGSPQPGSGSMR